MPSLLDIDIYTDTGMNRCAYHEAGHAVAVIHFGHTINYISIDSTRSGCVNWTNTSSNAYYEDTIVIDLAGNAAEKKYFGSNKLDCLGDIKSSFETVHTLIYTGRSELGLVYINELPNEKLQDDIIRLIQKESNKILNDKTKIAEEIIMEYKNDIQTIVLYLLHHKYLTGHDVSLILNKKFLQFSIKKTFMNKKFIAAALFSLFFFLFATWLKQF